MPTPAYATKKALLTEARLADLEEAERAILIEPDHMHWRYNLPNGDTVDISEYDFAITYNGQEWVIFRDLRGER
jgi:hypothetical protein